MLTRVLLLFSLAWIVKLTDPWISISGHELSGRDLILIGGGLFLIGKSTFEIHEKLEGEEGHASAKTAASFAGVLIQIMFLDIVFSLDSVITAVGMVDELWVMIAAVMISVGIMMAAAETDQRVRAEAPDGEDARAQLPAADRHVAHPRRIRASHSEGLHLLCDGILGVRGDDQSPRPEGSKPVQLHQPYTAEPPPAPAPTARRHEALTPID